MTVHPVVYRIEVSSIGRPRVWYEVWSIVSQQLSALVHAWCTMESKSHQQLDRWQQLSEQQDITVVFLCTIHFHLWLHENHTSALTPGDTN